jgi:alpha-beta hydrolase superfamily lysophospholipase
MSNSSRNARFARESYNLVKSGSKDKRSDLIDNNIKDTGFKVDRSKTNRDILYLVNPTTKEHHIAVRGTDTSGKKSAQDVLTDLTFAVGAEKHNKHFNKKVNRINRLVKNAPEDAKITASGHSLGGGIISEAMKNKKNVRNRVENVDSYNGAFSPFTKKASKKVEKELKTKVTHHRTKQDAVSLSSSVNNTTGIVKEYETKQHISKLPKLVPEHLKKSFSNVQQLAHHSIDNFIDDEHL